ncbi:hypothetical protein AZE42_14071 [Rhizopogon vesiculosus]|uniref:Uncharacterized protein n=1 Tax=Rhizopogon vesiculosus TaxID=180088 RepID=A0A1J8QD43_9AGAM|nr:hypothetical protein AZE42_14071 [Rhizopogon vesiculosus]
MLGRTLERNGPVNGQELGFFIEMDTK